MRVLAAKEPLAKRIPDQVLFWVWISCSLLDLLRTRSYVIFMTFKQSSLKQSFNGSNCNSRYLSTCRIYPLTVSLGRARCHPVVGRLLVQILENKLCIFKSGTNLSPGKNYHLNYYWVFSTFQTFRSTALFDHFCDFSIFRFLIFFVLLRSL